MSNTSDYAMKMIGSKEGITKLVSWLCGDENAEHHFYGIQYNSDINSAELIPYKDMFTFEVNGRCSVSVAKCMLNQPDTYFVQHSYEEDPKKIDLVSASKELGLTIEVFSYEDCCKTSEHIIIEKGNLTTNDVAVDKDLLWNGIGDAYFTIGVCTDKVEKMSII